MAYSKARKKSSDESEITSKKENRSSGNKKRKLNISIVIILVILLLLTYLVVFNPTSEDLPVIDRSLRFPEDEGYHDDEKMEYWTFNGIIESTNGDTFGYLVRYWSTGKRDVYLTDVNNITGETYYYEYNFPSSDVNASLNLNVKNDSLSLDYKNLNIHDTWEEIDTKNFIYELNTQMMPNNTELLILNLTLSANKDPVPIGEAKTGKVPLGIYGTIFSYIQSNLTISGQMTLNGITNYVAGYGKIEHGWGSSSIGRIETWTLMLSNGKEVLFTKFYDENRNNFLEYSYVIENDATFDVTLYPVDNPISYYDYQIQNISITNLNYWPNTQDPTGTQYYSQSWNIVSQRNDFYLTVSPDIKNQATVGTWEGIAPVTGTFQGQPVTGNAFINLALLYFSDIQITNVYDNYYSKISLEIPTDPVTVIANVSGALDWIEVTLIYDVNGGTPNVLPMIFENGNYTAIIPGPGINPTLEPVITYRISVTDATGIVKVSNDYSYTVSIEAP